MNIEEIDSTKVTPDNIWNFKQNKVSLMVDLIKNRYPEIDSDFLYEVALKTGIFKWFAVRRDLIKLKNKLRSWDRAFNTMNRNRNKVAKSLVYTNKQINNIYKDKGKHAMLIYIKEEIRKLCHSDRWQCPDFDRRANKWLKNKEMSMIK